jgi:hypothetical protein
MVSHINDDRSLSQIFLHSQTPHVQVCCIEDILHHRDMPTFLGPSRIPGGNRCFAAWVALTVQNAGLGQKTDTAVAPHGKVGNRQPIVQCEPSSGPGYHGIPGGNRCFAAWVVQPVQNAGLRQKPTPRWPPTAKILTSRPIFQREVSNGAGYCRIPGVNRCFDAWVPIFSKTRV